MSVHWIFQLSQQYTFLYLSYEKGYTMPTGYIQQKWHIWHIYIIYIIYIYGTCKRVSWDDPMVPMIFRKPPQWPKEHLEIQCQRAPTCCGLLSVEWDTEMSARGFLIAFLLFRKGSSFSRFSSNFTCKPKELRSPGKVSSFMHLRGRENMREHQSGPAVRR